MCTHTYYTQTFTYTHNTHGHKSHAYTILMTLPRNEGSLRTIVIVVVVKDHVKRVIKDVILGGVGGCGSGLTYCIQDTRCVEWDRTRENKSEWERESEWVRVSESERDARGHGNILRTGARVRAVRHRYHTYYIITCKPADSNVCLCTCVSTTL